MRSERQAASGKQHAERDHRKRETALTNTRLAHVHCRLTFQNCRGRLLWHATPSWCDAGRRAIQAPEEIFRVRGRHRHATKRAKTASHPHEDPRRSQQAAEAQRCICTAWLASARDWDGQLHGTAPGTLFVGQEASWQAERSHRQRARSRRCPLALVGTGPEADLRQADQRRAARRPLPCRRAADRRRLSRWSALTSPEQRTRTYRRAVSLR